MYSEFITWITDLEAFKLGMTFGCVLGVLIFFILTAIVEYVFDLLKKEKGKNDGK